MSSTALYTQYADVLALCQALKDDLAALLDPQTGFAPRLRQICRDRLEDAETLAPEETAVLRMEADTWGLLQAVMPARKTARTSHAPARTLLLQNPYTPTSTLAQAIMRASPRLAELVVVREWLHDTAPRAQAQAPEAAAGYWRATRHRLAQARRTEAETGVGSLDPDAMGREGLALAGEDMAYEKSLAHALYLCVRAGRLEEAMEMCRKARQPWRSASIRGSLLFEWRAITTGTLDAEDDADDGEPEFDGWRGNRRRKLWKTTCTKAALNPNVPAPDRLLSASLAPSPQTSALLKSACRTWSDHLWAQISVLVEEKQAAELRKLGGGFWEEENEDVEFLPPGAGEEGDEGWEEEVVGALTGLAGVGVEEGPPADHPLHISQLHVVLDRTDVLLDEFAEKLKNGEFSPAGVDYPHLTRFFAHLALFLRMIDVPVSPDAEGTILGSYLDVLESSGQRPLIVLYAHFLGANAVARYAQFLVSLGLTADLEERRQALRRAEEHGLDVYKVAVSTAEQTMRKALNMLPPVKGPLPAPTAATILSDPSPAELLFLRSLEWTTFREDMYGTALEQANVILRYFLAAGRIHIAAHLLSTLPPGLAAITQPEDLAEEYLGYRVFFQVRDTLERVLEFRAQETQVQAGTMSMEAEIRWKDGYKDALEHARKQTLKLLTSDWLVADVARGGDRRRQELIRIRQIYVPEFIIRAHVMLVESSGLFAENLAHALQVSTTVADSRYKLYDDFSDAEGKRLGEYLQLVREAVVKGVEGGGGDLWRPVRSQT
ncbi:hypothetical protein OE88DRAFT_1639447 [Heliocybe sulcata]|uniref:Nuclear pore complex protein n=1 Tax=Heliocybe sulcata TaxID=5364 RepID=A0A5C3MWF2_9AGAM|nr:hypothetical protein OE88DRAFT_1639447 [Heliocybe sulcata]